MRTNEITRVIVDSAYKIHNEVGPGVLESVYELLLLDALTAAGFRVAAQVPIPIRVGGRTFAEGFRADLLVEDCVIVEIKSVDRLAPVHKKQLLTYLRLSGISVGLLINFGGERLKGNIERVVTGDAPDLKELENDPLAS